jgi:ATP-dependent Clp protease ATP-binding subunit ClpC
MKNHFSQPFKEALSLSREEAIRLQNDAIGTGHLFLALMKQGGSNMARMFNQATIPIPDLQKEIETVIRRENNRAEITVARGMIRKKRLFGLFTSRRPAGICLSREAEKAIRESVALAAQMKSSEVGLKHLFLSILKDNKNFVADTLSGYGLSYQVVLSLLNLWQTI